MDSTLDPPVQVAATPRRRRVTQIAIEWGLVVILAIGGAIFIRTFVTQTFSVPSSSMYPTLQIGDRILVDRIPGLARSIHRGDVIVFHKVPGDNDGQPASEDLVKRVIGLPGETISSRGDTIYINGKPISEPWLTALHSVSPQGACYESAFDIKPTKIAANHYFVMGDCRQISDDSRYWGTVPKSSIIGRVYAVIWRSNHPWLHWL